MERKGILLAGGSGTRQHIYIVLGKSVAFANTGVLRMLQRTDLAQIDGGLAHA
jgi:hypothetical protein